jgi:hypothetical protein
MRQRCSSVANSPLFCTSFVQLKLFHSLEERRISLFISDKTERLISQKVSYLIVLKDFIEFFQIKKLGTA